MRGPSYAVGHRAGQNMAISCYARIGGRAGQNSQLDTMGKADKLFTDGEANERLMGRWSRLVGATFLYWARGIMQAIKFEFVINSGARH